MKFSIIVPVYNVEKYLTKCIESILEQNYSDYEILLIDDGSTDGSGKICDVYAAKYNKVNVFHKKNGGLSDARNYGMRYMKGEYVIFIDSDDWIEKNCLEQFALRLKDIHPDVLITRLAEAYEDEIIYQDGGYAEYLKLPLTKERAINWIMKLSDGSWPAVKNILSTDFVRKNGLQFAKGRLHEDVDWTSRVCYTAETYVGYEGVWYYHRMERVDSITNTIKAKNIIDVIEMAAWHYDYCNQHDIEMKRIIFNRIMSSVYSSINRIKNVEYKDKQKVIKCIKENERIFCVMPKVKYVIFVIAMKLLGVERALQILERV